MNIKNYAGVEFGIEIGICANAAYMGLVNCSLNTWVVAARDHLSRLNTPAVVIESNPEWVAIVPGPRVTKIHGFYARVLGTAEVSADVIDDVLAVLYALRAHCYRTTFGEAEL